MNKPYLIIGLPSYNFHKELQISKEIEQRSSFNYYYRANRKWNFKKFYIPKSNKSFAKKKQKIRDEIKEKLFYRCNERSALLINTTTGVIYGVANLKMTGKKDAFFIYTKLRALEKSRNLYIEKGYHKKNWYEFFEVRKKGGRQDLPHIFEYKQNNTAVKFVKQIIDSAKEDINFSPNMSIFKPSQKNVDDWSEEFANKVKFEFFIHEAELQHKLMEFLIRKIKVGVNMIAAADIFSEFPQYKKNTFKPSGKRFDVVIRDKFFDETVAYFELKLLRPSNAENIKAQILDDRDKIMKDAYYGNKHPFKLVVFSYDRRLTQSLKEDLKIKNVKIIQYEKPEHVNDNKAEVNEYIRMAALEKYE